MRKTLGLGTETCPSCEKAGGVGVVDSRPMAFGRRRRKRCEYCRARWSTLEITLSEAQTPAGFIGVILRGAARLEALEMEARKLRLSFETALTQTIEKQPNPREIPLGSGALEDPLGDFERLVA